MTILSTIYLYVSINIFLSIPLNFRHGCFMHFMLYAMCWSLNRAILTQREVEFSLK